VCADYQKVRAVIDEVVKQLASAKPPDVSGNMQAFGQTSLPSLSFAPVLIC
jgi:hypothetical protein